MEVGVAGAGVFAAGFVDEAGVSAGLLGVETMLGRVGAGRGVCRAVAPAGGTVVGWVIKLGGGAGRGVASTTRSTFVTMTLPLVETTFTLCVAGRLRKPKLFSRFQPSGSGISRRHPQSRPVMTMVVKSVEMKFFIAVPVKRGV